MAAKGSKKVIFAAMAGNGLIAITKFFAAAYTGSSAMLSEAIHSVVDTGNQGLLLYGIRRAKRPPDEKHPFGYGSEIYFWSFVVAILIFGVGAGVSFYEGIQKLLHPHPITSPYINYIVLALAMVFEAVAWWIAYKEFNRVRGSHGLFEAVQLSKDPTIFTVLFEDTAAMLGLVAALIGVLCADKLGIAWADGAASVAIGLILAGTAATLAYETKGLLIGESAGRRVINGIRRIVTGSPGVNRVNELRSMHLAPNDVLLALSIDFKDNMKVSEVEDTIARIESDIKSRFPEVKRLFIEVQGQEDHHRSVMMARRKRRAERQ